MLLFIFLMIFVVLTEKQYPINSLISKAGFLKSEKLPHKTKDLEETFDIFE